MVKENIISERIAKKYEYNGLLLGQTVVTRSRFLNNFYRSPYSESREFVPLVTETEVMDLVYEMDPGERFNMRRDAYPIVKLLDHYGFKPEDFIADEDVMIYVADQGHKTLTDLLNRDSRAWKFIKQRHLEEELFDGVVDQ